MSTEVTLEGFDELAKALENAQALFMPLASRAVALSLEAIQEAIEVVPPQPDRERSKTFNTWVREVGQLPRSAFVSSGGKGKIKTKNVKILRASERMPFRFTMKVQASGNQILGTLTNEASYSGWVLGPEEAGQDPHQVAWHAETGWVSTDQAILQAAPVIENSINDAIDEFLADL